MARGVRTPSRSVSVAGIPLVAMAAALWGTDALFRRALGLQLPAAVVVAGEHMILVALTIPWLIRALPRLRRMGPGDRFAVLLIGVGSSALATVLFTAAFASGDPTTPLLLQKVQPLIAVAGAALLLGERPLPRYGIYLVAGLAGSWLIAFPDPTAVAVSALRPALLALGAAALWAMGTVLGRRLATTVPPTELTALRFAGGLGGSAAILLIQGDVGVLLATTASDWGALLLLALIPGLLSLMLYYKGLGGTPASAATLAELAFPLTAILVNRIAFGTRLTPSQAVGIVVLSVTITAMGLAAARAREAGLGVMVPVAPQPKTT